MKKKSLKATIGSMLALGSLAIAPMQQVKAETPIQNEISGANKQAIKNNKRKGQGIKINDISGGIDFDYNKMTEHTSPIYFPQANHQRANWANQRRSAQKRKKAK